MLFLLRDSTDIGKAMKKPINTDTDVSIIVIGKAAKQLWKANQNNSKVSLMSFS
jgi:hypothetical protein